MPKKPAQTPKTCSRGHEYTGPGPCPGCWPAGAKRYAEERKRSRPTP